MVMNHGITYFIGSQTNATNGEVLQFKSFKDIGKEFNKCAKGAKHSAYFVRGELDPIHRKDVNLKQSTMLVIDGDEGIRGKNAPDPKLVHQALKKLKLNHFIYTTHSHSEEKNKFRCVVESESYQKKDLKINNGLLLAKLKDEDIHIKFVNEMNTWSQPWFVPTRDDPEDNLFEAYSYMSGQKWEIQQESVKNLNTVASKSGLENFETKSLDKLYESIRTGEEFHESLRNISYQLIKDNVSEFHVCSLLRMSMNGSVEAGSSRWQQRYDDIERLVKGAVARADSEKVVEEFAICDVNETEFDGDVKALPMPPGRLGQLTQEAYESSRYPDMQIAIVSTLGTVAGICGRKFNVDFADKNGQADPTGLNLYMTLVGSTGSGKDGIKSFIERILFNNNSIAPAASFLGSGEFTSVRALDHQVKDSRSQVCIDGEAGISMKNKTGDKAGVRKAILSLYGRSHHNGWSDPKTYSNSEETIPPRRAIALTRISESTEIELFAAYRDTDAFENGLIPRQSIFRIVQPTIKLNRNIRKKISDNLISKFNSLIEVCSAVQAVDDPTAHFIYCRDIELREEIYVYADKLKADSVSKEISRITQIMSSRMFVKALRYAGLAVVFNKDKADGDCLVLDWEEWNWAKKMVEYELSTVENCFAGYEDSADGAVLKVAICLSQLLRGTHKNKEANRLTDEMKSKNIVPLSVVQRLLRRDVEIKALAADPTRTSQIQDGVIKCLEYMQKIGTISMFERTGRKMIQVQPVFNDLYHTEIRRN